MSPKDVTPPKMPFTLNPKMIFTIIIVVAIAAVFTSSFFVVDQTGVVRYANSKYEVSKPAHFEAIFTALGELRKK